MIYLIDRVFSHVVPSLEMSKDQYKITHNKNDFFEWNHSFIIKKFASNYQTMKSYNTQLNKKKNYYDVTTYWRAVFFLFEPHFFLFISFVVFAVVGVVFEGWTDVLEQSEIGIAAE